MMMTRIDHRPAVPMPTADRKPAPLSDMSDLSDKSDKSAECAKRRGVIGTADRSEVKADNRKPETVNRKLLRVSARRAR